MTQKQVEQIKQLWNDGELSLSDIVECEQEDEALSKERHKEVIDEFMASKQYNTFWREITEYAIDSDGMENYLQKHPVVAKELLKWIEDNGK